MCGVVDNPLADRINALIFAATGSNPAALYLPGPSYWFTDAAKTSPVVNSDLIRVWADASGNGRDLTQATTASRMQATLSGGFWRATTDGVDDWMAWDSAVTVGFVAAVASATYLTTFPDFSSLLVGSVVDGAGEVLIGDTGTANLGSYGDIGQSNRMEIDGVQTYSFLPSASPRRVLAWGSSPQSLTRLVLGGGRSTFPPSSRFWGGQVCAVVVTSAIPDATTRASLYSLLAEVTP